MTPYLFVQRIKQLLPGRCAGEGGAVIKRSAKAAKVEQALGSAVKGNAHAIEQIDDARRGVTHIFYRRLIGEKVAAINSVIEVLPRRVTFALQVLGGIDATLSAD